MSQNRMQDEYELWCEDWKPQIKGQNHPTSYEGFEAGWMACLEVMLERLELSKV